VDLDVMESVRSAIEQRVLSLTGQAIGGIDYDKPKGDPGLFGPNSMCWKVHGDFPCMLAGGISALLLQMLHPLALAGVWDHSNFREDMLGRFRRTARFVSATTFAPATQARGEIDKVNRIHSHIRGTSTHGATYSATDPDLLTWVHAAEVSSFLKSFMAFSPDKLTAAEQDRYFAETAEIAGALGAAGVPVTKRGMDAYLEDMKPRLVFDERTRSVRDTVRSAPAPNWAASLMRWPYLTAGFSILPPFAKAMYGEQPAVTQAAAIMAVRVSAVPIRWSLRSNAAKRSRRRVSRDPSH
jgi:uncharacterized protein (DUF2236 family)